MKKEVSGVQGVGSLEVGLIWWSREGWMEVGQEVFEVVV